MITNCGPGTNSVALTGFSGPGHIWRFIQLKFHTLNTVRVYYVCDTAAVIGRAESTCAVVIITITTTSVIVPVYVKTSTPCVLCSSLRPEGLGAWCHWASGTPVWLCLQRRTSLYITQSDLRNTPKHLALPGAQHFFTPSISVILTHFSGRRLKRLCALI